MNVKRWYLLDKHKVVYNKVKEELQNVLQNRTPNANDFANEVPTNKDPIKPGPRVNAIADNISFVILACSQAC